MARSDELRALGDRWDHVGEEDLQSLAAGLQTGRVESPFGRVHGRVDLRGLPLIGTAGRATIGERAPSRRKVPANGPAWTQLDLSGASLAQMNWFQLILRDCVLDDANLSGLRCWGVKVLDTSMRRSVLFHAQLGAGQQSWPHRSHWHDVDLRQSDLRGAIADARFEQIDFRNAKFTGTDLGWSDLINCQFAGVMRGLTIGRRPITDRPSSWTLQGVDLTAARPRDLNLIGVDIGAPTVDMRFPSDSEHWMVSDWKAFLARVAECTERLPAGRDRRASRIWLDYAQRDTGPDQTEGFVSSWDLDRLGVKR